MLFPRIERSVKVWTIAFLSVDIVFWLYVVYSCQVDPLMCMETVGFSSFFFYLPFSFIPLPLGDFSLAGTAVVGSLAHGFMGAGVGWLLRKRSVNVIVATLVAFAVVGVLMFGLAQLMRTQELKRETKTQVWTVEAASASELKFTVQNEPGTVTLNMFMLDTSDTKVKLATSCSAGACSFNDDDMDTIAYDEFLATKPIFPIVFEVTSNPQAIISMRQVPQL